MLADSGYKGGPVILIGGSEIPAYAQMSLVTVDVLKRIGMNVDTQMSRSGYPRRRAEPRRTRRRRAAGTSSK